MDELVVDPDYVKQLATTQDEAATKEEAAAGAASNISTSLWVSHGVVCGASNVAVTNAEAARRAAGTALKQASNDLAEKLRVASEAYVNTDEETGEGIDKQVVDG